MKLEFTAIQLVAATSGIQTGPRKRGEKTARQILHQKWRFHLIEGRACGLPLWLRASLVAQLVKNPPAIRETWVQSLGWEDPLEKRTATHSSILAWRIPCTMQPMGSQRVGHNWVTFTSLHFTGDFPGGPVVKTSSSNVGGWVQSPIGELRSHTPWGQKPKH